MGAPQWSDQYVYPTGAVVNRATAFRDVVANLITAALREAPEPLTLSAIAKRAKKRNGCGRPAAKRLVDAGTIEPVDVRGFVGYRLAVATPAAQ